MTSARYAGTAAEFVRPEVDVIVTMGSSSSPQSRPRGPMLSGVAAQLHNEERHAMTGAISPPPAA